MRYEWMLARVLAGGTAARKNWDRGEWVVGQKRQGMLTPFLRSPAGEVEEFAPTAKDIEADDWQAYAEDES